MNPDNTAFPAPTPDQIAAACEEIRSEWTERIHWQRATGQIPRPVTVTKARYTAGESRN